MIKIVAAFCGVSPLVVQLVLGLGGAVVFAGAYAGWHHHVYHQGYDAAVAAVAEQNKEAVDAVDQHRTVVRECHARDGMRWDQSARQCVQRD